MQRMKEALEALDQIITELEDRIEVEALAKRAKMKEQNDAIKAARAREASAIAVAQKVAARLDHTIGRVENVLGGHA
jgi:hypothetical protein